MGKQYFCDYCVKGFPDNRSSRQKHLKSNQHKMAYKEYYSSQTDPLTMLCLRPKSVRFYFLISAYTTHLEGISSTPVLFNDPFKCVPPTIYITSIFWNCMSLKPNLKNCFKNTIVLIFHWSHANVIIYLNTPKDALAIWWRW